MSRRSLLVGAAAVVAACGKKQSETLPAVRCAIIGGMTKTGMWPELARRFHEASGIASEVVVTGSREVLAPVLREGRVDLITMHENETIHELVAEGHAADVVPWAQNDHVIIGPKDDPATIRGLTNAAEVVRRIVAAKATIVLHGKAERVLRELAESAGVSLDGASLVQSRPGAMHAETVALAAERHAYSLVGRIPFRVGEAYPAGVELLVEGDPRLRKTYIVATANPKRWPATRHESAQRLVAFLLEPRTQSWLGEFGRHAPADGPLFFPISTPQPSRSNP